MSTTITAKTTDEELNKPLVYSRESLIESVQSGARYTDLADAVNAVARAQGRVQVRTLLRNALAMGASVEAIRLQITSLLLNGTDDEWSGRTNDARRAHFDGFRAEAHDLLIWQGHLENLVAISQREASEGEA